MCTLTPLHPQNDARNRRTKVNPKHIYIYVKSIILNNYPPNIFVLKTVSALYICSIYSSAFHTRFELRHEIYNKVVCATSKASDQPAHVQSDRSLCLLLEYSLTLKLLTKHHLEFLSLKGGCTGSYESTLVKMPHCWKAHVTAQTVQVYTCRRISFLVSVRKCCDNPFIT